MADVKFGGAVISVQTVSGLTSLVIHNGSVKMRLTAENVIEPLRLISTILQQASAEFVELHDGEWLSVDTKDG